MFEPFKMPDFCSRPEGTSKTLKETYVRLRMLDYPDRDIFIYAQGEFNKFKGEMLEQQPQAGEMVYPGERITLVAAVSGLSQIMPDLFTDHIGSSLHDTSNPRHGAKNLFAIFDSMFLKILCRLEWIRDIYAGVYQSSRFVDYLNSIFFIPETRAGKLDYGSQGFLLSRLSRFLGTENALKVFLESVTQLRVDTRILGNLKTSNPDNLSAGIGADSRLGENIFLGDEFESEKPELDICFGLESPEDVKKFLEVTGDQKFLEDVFGAILPYYMKDWKISVEPEREELSFVNGKSFLGVSSALGYGDHERS